MSEKLSGGDKNFLVAWGSSAALVNILAWISIVLVISNLGMVGLCVYLAGQGGRVETYTFLKDHLGNVVQVPPESILKAGDVRDDAEVKGFIRDWLHDAYVYTPLDVVDKGKAALNLVDAKAMGVARDALRFPERAKLTNNGVSSKIYDEAQEGKEIQYVIERRNPLTVLVSFSRYSVDGHGQAQDMGRIYLRIELKAVLRTPSFSHGLIITDLNYSARLI